jgi:transketolase
MKFSLNFEEYKGLKNYDIIRKVLFDIGKNEKDIIVLSADASNTSGEDLFKEKFPDRTFNFGIAEANMISAAAGLAMLNKIPVVGIYGFLIPRVAEQIRDDICYNNKNVKIFSCASGLDYATGGMSHQGVEDISILMSFANISIIQPASSLETILAIYEVILNYQGPVYLRLARTMNEVIYENEKIEFKIGKAITVKEGNDITLIATGVRPVNIALKATEILKKEGISVRLVNMNTIKPLDKEAIIRAAKETKGIITIEEGVVSGGLGAAVCRLICENHPTMVKIIGLSEYKFTTIGPSPRLLCDYFGINELRIIEKAKNILAKKFDSGESYNKLYREV